MAILMSLGRYIHFYHRCFYLFYLKDLFVGIPHYMKKKFK